MAACIPFIRRGECEKFEQTGWCPFDHPVNGEATPVLDFAAIERFLLAIIAGDQAAVEQMLHEKLVDISIVIGPHMRKSVSPQCAKEVMGKSAVSLAAWHGKLQILKLLLEVPVPCLRASRSQNGGSTDKLGDDETMSPQFAAVSGAQVWSRCLAGWLAGRARCADRVPSSARSWRCCTPPERT